MVSASLRCTYLRDFRGKIVNFCFKNLNARTRAHFQGNLFSDFMNDVLLLL